MSVAGRSARLIVATAVAAAALALPASTAWAHVAAEAVQVSPEGAAVVNFGFSHGCDGAPTTALRVQVPEGVSQVVPEPVDGWTVSATTTEFGWSGGSIPDHTAATFTATMQVTGSAGTVISFPTIQQCGDAEEAWVEIQEPGAPEPDRVAPSITLTATITAPVTTTPAPPTTAAAEGVTPTTRPTGLATTTTLPAGAVPEKSETNTGGLVVGLITVGIIAGGALVLYLTNRRPKSLRNPTSTETPPRPTDEEPPADKPRRSPH